MVAGVSANGYTRRIMEGEPIGTFFMYEFAGYNDAGKATYYEHDAKTGARTGNVVEHSTYKDRTIVGNAQTPAYPRMEQYLRIQGLEPDDVLHWCLRQ